MQLSAREKLKSFYEQFSGEDHVLIVINADPDAIASAMAIKRLLWRKTTAVTISNVNIIKRPDNLAMIRLLNVPMTHIDDIDMSLFSRFVIVDSQPNHHESLEALHPHVIIDHHPDTGADAPFRDIRPAYGATASIMTEYLKSAKIKPSMKLATGLFHAIKTDTSNFKRQTLIEDVRAFQFLFKHANMPLARRIEQAEIHPNFLKYFKKALQEKRIRKGRIYVHLGQVVNPDVCVLIADFFMRIESVNWSIVSGLYDKKLVIIFRNDGIRKNAGTVAKQGFGSLGSAGGHKSAARAEMLVTDLKTCVEYRDEKKLLKWIMNTIDKRAVTKKRNKNK